MITSLVLLLFSFSLISLLFFHRGFHIFFLIFFHGIIKGFNLKTIYFIWSQSYHETGGFKSALFLQAKNLFGMMVPSLRKSYGIIGEYKTPEGKMAVYSSYTASVLDYFLRGVDFNMPKNFDNLTDFNKWLKNSGYYSDTANGYLSGLQFALANLKQWFLFVSVGIITTPILVFISVYKVLKIRNAPKR